MKISWIRGGNFPGLRKTIQIVQQRGEGGPLLQVGKKTYAIMRKEDANLTHAERFAALSQSNFAKARMFKGIRYSSDEVLVDTGRPYSAKRFLSRKEGSRVVPYKSCGKFMTGEIINDPAVSCSHIKKTYFESLNKIAKAAWGNFPKEWIFERFMKVEKAVIIRDKESVIGVMAVKKVTFEEGKYMH